jgi:hypothetical protein
VLPVFAATVIALAWANPMGFDVQQRVSGALGLICFAYFLSHTIHKWSIPTPPVRPQVEALPATRPQLLIVKWGQIDEATYTAHDRAPHIVQHGFFIRNFGLGETAIGVRVKLTVPIEIPDVWTSGEGASPTIAIGKDQENGELCSSVAQTWRIPDRACAVALRLAAFPYAELLKPVRK